jgi:hypothetical protein
MSTGSSKAGFGVSLCDVAGARMLRLLFVSEAAFAPWAVLLGCGDGCELLRGGTTADG